MEKVRVKRVMLGDVFELFCVRFFLEKKKKKIEGIRNYAG